jgi:hypothetical protein
VLHLSEGDSSRVTMASMRLRLRPAMVVLVLAVVALLVIDAAAYSGSKDGDKGGSSSGNKGGSSGGNKGGSPGGDKGGSSGGEKGGSSGGDKGGDKGGNGGHGKRMCFTLSIFFQSRILAAERIGLQIL